MGTNHARILRDLDSLEAIVEQSPTRRKRLHELGYGKFLRSSIEETDSHGYVIATPSASHREILEKALQKTNFILLEKPALLNEKEYKKVIENFDTSKICVGHIERFNPAVEKAKEDFANSSSRCEFFRYSSRPKQINDVGVWKDLGVHDVDLMIHFMGMPSTVVCHAVMDNDIDISFHANFGFSNGKSAAVNVSWLSTAKRREIQMYGLDGEANIDLLKQKISCLSEHQQSSKPDNHFSPTVSQSKMIYDMARAEPLRREIEHFLRVLKGEEEPLISLEHAQLVELIVSKSYQSFQLGKRIEI